MEETFPRGKKRGFEESTERIEKHVKKEPIQKDDGLDDLFSEKPEEKLHVGEEGGQLKKKAKKKAGLVDKKANGKSDEDSGLKKKKGKDERAPKKTSEGIIDHLLRGAPEKYDKSVLPGTLLLGNGVPFFFVPCFTFMPKKGNDDNPTLRLFLAGIVQEVEPYMLKVSLPGEFLCASHVAKIPLSRTPFPLILVFPLSLRRSSRRCAHQRNLGGIHAVVKVLVRRRLLHSRGRNIHAGENVCQRNFDSSQSPLCRARERWWRYGILVFCLLCIMNGYNGCSILVIV